MQTTAERTYLYTAMDESELNIFAKTCYEPMKKKISSFWTSLALIFSLTLGKHVTSIILESRDIHCT